MRVALVILLAAAPLHADNLGDVRAALTKLAGNQPLTARVQITRSRHSKGRFLNDDFEGSAVAQVEDDATGLHVMFPRALTEPSQPLGASNAAAELIPVSINNSVDFGRTLLRMLSGARVTQRTAQMIELSLPPGTEGSLTLSEDRLTLWCSADHVPFAAQRVRKGSAGILFVRMETIRTEKWELIVVADHLVATRFEDASSVSGPGQHGEARSVWTVRDVTTR